MGLFDELQSQWQEQQNVEPPEGGSRVVRSRLAYLNREARITTWILLATAAGVIGFFVYLGAFANVEVLLAMGLMVGGLIFRIALEVYGRHCLRQMDPTRPTTDFQARLHGYYRHRNRVHMIATPVSLMAYGLGFAMLIPEFKATLSAGFYAYILISGAIFALVLIWIILAQARREMRLLRELHPEPAD